MGEMFLFSLPGVLGALTILITHGLCIKIVKYMICGNSSI